jgi:hypothetical protein
MKIILDKFDITSCLHPLKNLSPFAKKIPSQPASHRAASPNGLEHAE